MRCSSTDQASTPAYRHAALLYAGADGFLDGTVKFIQDGVAADEPTLVVLPKHKIEPLREAVGEVGTTVQFADMQLVGSNPARIIPAWQCFVGSHPGRKLRGIGEPIFPERGAAELRECQHHERLLNPALQGSNLYLLCPYDTAAMSDSVIEEARRSHPLVSHDGVEVASADYLGAEAARGMLHEALPEPPVGARSLPEVGVEELAAAREFVEREAQRAGLPLSRQADLVLAVNEIATNSIRHGGQNGSITMWRDASALFAEVRGGGQIEDALVDRTVAAPREVGNRGLWIANQLCDLVQLRSLRDGVVARITVRLP